MSVSAVHARQAVDAGPYRLLARIGRGGMAEVFAAIQVRDEAFSRLVAVKRPLDSPVADESWKTMLLDEVQIAAGIQHPNVVSILDAYVHDGVPHIVMEYLVGATLGALIDDLHERRQRLPGPVAAWIVASIAAGLHAAHELCGPDGQPRDVVHRDVSPQNIFITNTGGVKVLDFGIARASQRRTQTQAGQLKGKFHYMAPEYLRLEPVDRRADVWALGVVLHELLRAEPLFRHKDLTETVQAVMSAPIPALGGGSDPRIDAFTPIVMSALSRDPAARTATARELRGELLRVLAELGHTPMELEEELAQLVFPLAADAEALERQLRAAAVAETSASRAPGPITAEEPETKLLSSPEPVVDATPISSTDKTRVRRRRVARRSVFAPALGVLGLAAVLGTLWFVGPGSGAHRANSAQETAVVEELPVAVSAPPQMPEPSAPEHGPARELQASDGIELTVDGAPVGARVLLDGELLGTVPLHARLPRAHRSRELSIALEQYESDTIAIVPDVDRAVRISLEPDNAAETPDRRHTSVRQRPTVVTPTTTMVASTDAPPFGRAAASTTSTGSSMETATATGSRDFRRFE